MAKVNKSHYIIDGLDKEKAEILSKSLKIVPEIKGLSIDIRRSLIEVDSVRDVEAQIKLACGVAGVIFRTKLTKRDF